MPDTIRNMQNNHILACQRAQASQQTHQCRLVDRLYFRSSFCWPRSRSSDGLNRMDLQIYQKRNFLANYEMLLLSFDLNWHRNCVRTYQIHQRKIYSLSLLRLYLFSNVGRNETDQINGPGMVYASACTLWHNWCILALLSDKIRRRCEILSLHIAWLMHEIHWCIDCVL